MKHGCRCLLTNNWGIICWVSVAPTFPNCLFSYREWFFLSNSSCFFLFVFVYTFISLVFIRLFLPRQRSAVLIVQLYQKALFCTWARVGS